MTSQPPLQCMLLDERGSFSHHEFNCFGRPFDSAQSGFLPRHNSTGTLMLQVESDSTIKIRVSHLDKNVLINVHMKHAGG